MKYNVTVKRVEQREHTFEVDADSPEEAEEKALESACDHDFNQNSVSFADEEVVSVEGEGSAEDHEEEARALGFCSHAEALKHEKWLNENGSTEYKAWRAQSTHRV